MRSTKIDKATQEVYKYLDSLRYEDIINERVEKLHNRIFNGIAKAVCTLYSDIDITDRVELAVSTSTGGGAASIAVTGYVKISEGKYIPIEKTYKPGRVFA
jgi:hypothetical protein